MRSAIALVPAIALATAAHAQSTTTGAITGRLIAIETRAPIEDATVIVSGPALQLEQVAITDERGNYKISELPPGEYTIAFYIAGRDAFERPHVPVSANHVTFVSETAFLKPRDEMIVIIARPPPIDPVTTRTGVQLERNLLQVIPMRSRTFDAVADRAPATNNDGTGAAVAGSTSLENRYLVDGIDVTNLTYGDIGTPVLNDFIEEVEVMTGGYDAEWGRATGGIVNAVTKAGSNQFRGSVFANFQPGFLTAGRAPVPTNASSIEVLADRGYTADLGFEVGGPIVKDKLWFYVGLAPQLARTDFTRITTRQTDCHALLPNGKLSSCDARSIAQGGFADGAPDIDPTTGFFVTDEIDRDVRAATSQQYSMIGKLNYAHSYDHQAQLSAIAVPSRSRTPGIYGLPSTGTTARGMTLDGAARWTSKLNDGKTQVEAMLGWHHAQTDTEALDPALDAMPAQILSNGNLGAWSALGGESLATTNGCADGTASDPYTAITNCPVTTGYSIAGPGALHHDREDRVQARLSLGQRMKLAGYHELKLGLDVEDDHTSMARLFSGGAFIQNNVPGEVDITRWVQLGDGDQMCNTVDADGANRAYACSFVPGERGAPGAQIDGHTLNWAAYLRDSWQLKPNWTLNLGLRYEEQHLLYAQALRDRVDLLTGNPTGRTAMDLTGNWAPRVGLIWDPTKEGRSKIYAAWGRYYESIPMDLNHRSFGGEVSFQQTFASDACGAVDPRIGAADGMGCLDKPTAAVAERLIGGSGVLVAPGIKAEYLDEVTAGTEYQIGEDTKIGVVYQHRKLGRVIEDVSADGAQTFVIANPGEFSDDAERDLAAQIAATEDPAIRTRLERQLAQYRGIRGFDRPSRNYDAVSFTFQRRFAKNWLAQGSYTFSRAEGNYPGSLSYDNGQRDPNISSQFDLVELLANRRGRLPQDRPHSLKLEAYHVFELNRRSALTVGARFRAVSGIPENALAAHYLYGANESFLLPRGMLGRTDFDHAVDAHVGYGRQLNRTTRAEAFVDVFNLYNQQNTFDIDATYAPAFRIGGGANNVNPISGGSYQDLIWAKTIDRSGRETSVPAGTNPNFRQPTTRYAPAAAQIGLRLAF